MYAGGGGVGERVWSFLPQLHRLAHVRYTVTIAPPPVMKWTRLFSLHCTLGRTCLSARLAEPLDKKEKGS